MLILQKVKRTIFILFYIIVLTTFTQQNVFASTYGSGNYGSSIYNNGSSNSSASSGSSSSSGGSSGNNNHSNPCTNIPPVSYPDLYEIDIKGINATLYLAPPPMPYSNYQISFGNGSKDEGYNVTFPMNNAKGAIAYTVQDLQPNTSYTFKVRALNGCMPGKWSSDLAANSQGKDSSFVEKYYPSTPPVIPYVPVKNVVTTQSGTYQKGSPAQFVVPPQQRQTVTQNVQPKNSNSTSAKSSGGKSWWGSIINFISHFGL